MRKKWSLYLCYFVLPLIALLLITSGCRPDPVVPDDPPEAVVEGPDENGEDANGDEEVVEPPHSAATYYWPWLSHGLLELSSGEIVAGPDLFESELGFISEFTQDYSYEGRLYWLVQDTDVFALEWANLSFSVEYYEDFEWQHELTYEFQVEELQPEPADDGTQEFTLNLVEQHEGFEVTLVKIIMGKEQEGSFTTDPINYVALDIKMQVVSNP